MIAIKSNKELYFPDGKGFVTIKINLIQNIPEAKVYTMRLEDSCSRNIVDESGNTNTILIGSPKIRF